MIPVSVFESKDDNRPVEHRLPWASLADRLCRYDERQTKDGKAWSPVTYKPGTTRGKANVDQVYLLVLDFDHAVVDWKLIENFEYCGHTTYQHTREAPRWRIIVLLERPIGGQDWPEFWLRAQAFFGGCVDPTTKDSSRIFYLPSCPPGSDHEVCRHHGQALDPDSLPAVPQYAPTPRVTSEPHAYRRYLGHWAARFCQHLADTLSLMPRESGRNSACNRAAYTLAGLVADEQHDLSVDTITQVLFEACLRNRLVEEDGERSVRATITSGLEDGLQRPWSPSDRDLLPNNVRPFVGRTQVEELITDVDLLDMVAMETIESEEVEWLWYGRLARGKLCVMAGDPGLGKSLVTLHCAAVVSKGLEWPDGALSQQGSVIVMSAEDDAGDTIRPRLDAAGADASQVHLLRGVYNKRGDSDSRIVQLQTDMQLLKHAIASVDAKLVIIDPLNAYLSGVDSHKASEVRAVLAPLAKIAGETGAAVLLVMHLNKGTSLNALYRAGGSVDFVAAARCMLSVAIDNDDPERRLLVCSKLNIAQRPPSLGFRIVASEIARVTSPPILHWDVEPVSIDPMQAFAQSSTSEERWQRNKIIEVLAELFGGGNELPLPELKQHMREAGLGTSDKALRGALERMGAQWRRNGYQTGSYVVWYLPAQSAYFSPTSPVPKNDILGEVEKTRPTSPSSPGPPSFPTSPSFSTYFKYTREGNEENEVRLCPHCQAHFTLEGFQAHLLGLGEGLPEDTCPIHRVSFDEHDCELLSGDNP